MNKYTVLDAKEELRWDSTDINIDRVLAKLSETIINLEAQLKSKDELLMEAYESIVKTDNLMLEETGYTYNCDTHDHDQCDNCIINKAQDYMSKES